ncbi:hypothetical protein HPP92_023607 [Vanilla planifolia]|uniref:glucan endo-1,3-beta-D-glucosidase n=1 Tax=Vanilla planifolia TaxID=51239 RepID=A0A835PQN7_VANPL|nr:hypothetical protein HPP92_023607 [Vanilla planifolia]
MEKKRLFLLMFTLLQAFFASTTCQPYLGVNYGEMADNLPPPQETANLLASTNFYKLRLYNANHSIIQSMAGTGISLVLGVSNGDIPSLATNPLAATNWVSTNLLPFYPATSFYSVSVGNEALNSSDPSLSSLILPAMRNLRAAISVTSAADVKVSTVHSMVILSQSEPPSSGAFHSDLIQFLAPILDFLSQTGSPFMINPYPYFAYTSDPQAETLAFCLFQPNPGRFDPGSGITYSNMFDAQVDAVRAALKTAGYPGVDVVVAETGWPYRGDEGEVGASLENARAYNGNLVAHLKGMVQPVETYIFALYDEDLKPGPLSERSFGLFHPNLTPIYDAGLLKSTQPGSLPAPSSTNPGGEALKPGNCSSEMAGELVCGEPAVQNLPNAAVGRRELLTRPHPVWQWLLRWLTWLTLVLAY